MRYKTGMYGGSFDPLHIGHIHDMIRAASVCEELYVVLSWCEGRESTPKELRYRWIYSSVSHLSNVKILLIEDKAVTKEEYDSDFYWEKGAADIKAAVGKPIEAVFCGSDYLGTERFERLYGAESDVVYFNRKEVPISSTELRNGIFRHWAYIPPACRPYYVKKVLIVGSESTGKSTLAQNLSLAYNTNFVSEVGRETCQAAGGEEYMTKDDLIENLVRQKADEIRASEHSNRLLFIDTDAVTTEFYARFLLSDEKEILDCCRLADAICQVNRFDLILFLEPTVDFIQDGTRNETIAADRIKYSRQIKELFDSRGLEYETLDGDYLYRFDRAKQLISERFGIETV